MNHSTIFVGLAVFVYLIGPAVERAVRRRKLEERHSISDEDIAQKLYSGATVDRESLLAAWHRVAQVMHVDPGKLRPEDQMEIFTKPRLNLDSDVDDLYVILDSLAPFSETMEPLHTINDVVLYLARAIRDTELPHGKD